MTNDNFLRACRREDVDHTPVWLMRQAGRYMKEYMALKEKYSFLEMCRTPEIACEVTLQPINAFELDAA
ncbi:MAG: uroporphyrinogen decarboxylase, partial [Deltaproteobacteria bacterium]|nr:uroporphyrinogen decarboxylase [Deltaproteobacteria bacterium]